MLNIIYAGTPEFAVPALESLIASNHRVVAVYTQPDRPAGRGRKLQISPVKECALQHGLEVIQPPNFKHKLDVEKLQAYHADLMVVAAYGILLPTVILQAPRLGCINIHGSLLPRWRGAAPIQRAILSADQQTGITLMQMDAGLDTGEMLAKSYINIGDNTTAAELHDALKTSGAKLLMENLQAIENCSIKGQPQENELATYARKLTKQEALIDWNKSAVLLHREIRAFNPWPVSHTTLQGVNVKVWSASLTDKTSDKPAGQVISHDKQSIQVSCGDGVLSLNEIQFAGKKRGTAAQLLNSRPLLNECFGY